jgi:ubiquinone/menaquinone biosynthesis C-methylase UbiE
MSFNINENGYRHDYSSLMAARAAMNDGKNILEVLRNERKSDLNSIEEIEISYDLQSGSYSRAALQNRAQWLEYGSALANHVRPHTDKSSSFLDCGTGELTSLTAIQFNEIDLGDVFALDLSWSRLSIGRDFVHSHGSEGFKPTLICGDILNLPFDDNSIDVIMTVHALEPNGGREHNLLSEILRVARKKVILFEPCFERSSFEVQERMSSHGYVRNLEDVIVKQGGEIEDLVPFEVSANPLNPTWVFTVNPPKQKHRSPVNSPGFSCPITRTSLTKNGGWLYSPVSGLAYPILQDIALLRPKHAVLASALTFTNLL